MIARLAIAAAIAAGCSGDARDRGPELQVVGETVKLRLGDPLPAESAVFDGTTLRLRGARGEVLGVQLLRRSNQPVPARLTIGGPGVTVHPFAVDYADVRQPSSELFGPSLGPGRFPDRLAPAEDTVTATPGAFFDVAIASDAPDGARRGELQVGDRSFEVVLQIEPIVIDLSREPPLVWVWYLPAEVARAHDLPDDDSPAQLAVEQRYVDLFAAHGAYLMNDPSPDRFAARRSLFDPRARYWPVWTDKRNRAAMQRDVARWLDIFASLPQVPFTIPVDEPRTAEARTRVNGNAAAIREAGGGWPRLLHAVTDRYRPSYDDGIDLFISPNSVPPPADARRPDGRPLFFWTYNGKPPQAGAMVIDAEGVALRTWGWIAHRYDLALWYAWEGLYFTDRYNGAKAPTDLMATPITFDERRRGGSDWGNGDGLLAYPGPLPTLRLKALRRGLQDRLMLRALARCGEAARADAIARAMVPRALSEAGPAASWPTEEPTWERARQALLDLLVERCADD